MYRFGLILSFCGAAFCAAAETLVCPNGRVTVAGGDQSARYLTCEAAKAGLKMLDACNVIVNRDIKVKIVNELKAGCVGLYHCGEDLIEILHPVNASRLRSNDSPFRRLSAQDYYASIIVHELAHAAFDQVPCPYPDCPATAEYVSYAMQVRSLGTEQIEQFEVIADVNRLVRYDDLNSILLMMSPNRFAALAWTHFKQREDGCDYIELVMSGNILFDKWRPQ